MSDPVFDAAVALVIQHEAGESDNAADHGGLTKFGISQASYPDLDIAALTVEKAKSIYYTDWWLRYRICSLPTAISPKVLDTAVLAGPGTAITMLQRACNAVGAPCAVDGAIGPKTCAACASVAPSALLAAYRGIIVRHYEQIVAADPTQAVFLAGWEARAMA